MGAALVAECSADIGRYDKMRHERFAKRSMVEDADWGGPLSEPESPTPAHSSSASPIVHM